ncbi:MAG: alanine--tRNA ligase-related protein [Patescibacteria group bacterium]
MEKLSSQKIRELWKQFWESNNHKFLTPASLIPDSKDKTVLFTTAGMQQLVPYLVGKPHEL